LTINKIENLNNEIENLKRKLRIKEYHADKGIVRLIIGEMHRQEREATWPILEEFKPKPLKGSIIIVPTVDIEGKVNISVINPKYTETTAYKTYCAKYWSTISLTLLLSCTHLTPNFIKA